MILPQTVRAGAAAVAERLRSAVATHAFPLAPVGSITVSAGIAVFPEDGDNVTSLIASSDRTAFIDNLAVLAAEMDRIEEKEPAKPVRKIKTRKRA